MNRFLVSVGALALILPAAGALAQAPAAAQPAPAAAQPAPTATQPAPAAAPSAAAAMTQAAPGAAFGLASDGKKVMVGATIKDASGGVVGTVDAVDAKFATVSTANTKAKVKVPLASFAVADTGPVLGMTAAQLEGVAGQAAAQAAAAGPPQLTVGQAVADTTGAQVGTIQEVGDQYAVVATAKNKVRLPLNAFADRGKGIVIGMSEAQLDAAAEAAAPQGQ